MYNAADYAGETLEDYYNDHFDAAAEDDETTTAEPEFVARFLSVSDYQIEMRAAADEAAHGRIISNPVHLAVNAWRAAQITRKAA